VSGRRALAHERFLRLPHRLRRRLEARDGLNFAQWGLLTFLLSSIDDLGDGEVAYTLQGLSDACGWPKGQEELRRELHRLKAALYIDFKSIPGQRTPWVFRIGRAGDVESSATTSAKTSVSAPPDLHQDHSSHGGADLHPPVSVVARERLDRPPKPTSEPPPASGDVPADETRRDQTGEVLTNLSAGGSAPPGARSIIDDCTNCRKRTRQDERDGRWVCTACDATTGAA
jgi:hypothetical protein